ncbi:hypothetical protein UNSWDHB_1779 [Dehalobacter sp. UNSWDHB]|nr:hypothetical protein [Dehalobacter sp. UNSWDHB]AFV02686.1 hypothetical protein DHBDCA_p1660 [Dehalobacter sp. DCA]AFV05671.1 hypothetical protein DCF50_p1669 [Dehalobacter sp. CF]EQB20895.1 hypothetical protein UNSWDHB_1779 [Dehalobacter sp. UNSWDHB]
MSKNGKSYDEQFKKDIVRLIQEENRSIYLFQHHQIRKAASQGSTRT